MHLIPVSGKVYLIQSYVSLIPVSGKVYLIQSYVSFNSCQWKGVLDTILCDKDYQLIKESLWLSSGTQIFFTDITEIIVSFKNTFDSNLYIFIHNTLPHLLEWSCRFFIVCLNKFAVIDPIIKRGRVGIPLTGHIFVPVSSQDLNLPTSYVMVFSMFNQ